MAAATHGDPLEPRWIASPQALAEVTGRWRNARQLALDTEFERSRTFYPRAALIQVFDGDQVGLIDPVAIDDLTPLAELLADQRIEKVMHSCGEDLEVFQSRLGCLPEPIFDTQVAAALLGLGQSVGYRALVAELEGVELPKDQTRSDWLARPLSTAQMRYATLDVAHLLPLAHKLDQRLHDLGRRAWLSEECTRALDAARTPPAPEQAYLRVGAAWQLDRRQLAVLRALCAWREHEARRRDRPRAFVLRDEVMLALSRKPPRSQRELERFTDLHPRERARSGARLIELVSQALALPHDEQPAALTPPLEIAGFADTIKRLRRIVQRRAESLNLPPAVLAQRRVVEDLVRRVRVEGRRELPPTLRGWRLEAVGQDLLAALDEPAETAPDAADEAT